MAAPIRFPSFLSANGPVREARFVTNPDGTPDGGVHALFTITGRIGATGLLARRSPTSRRQLAQPQRDLPDSDAGVRRRPDRSRSRMRPSSPTRRPTQRRKPRSGIRGRANFARRRAGPSAARPTTTATTAPSPASAGRRRTSRCCCSPARPTTSRWASPTSCSRPSATRTRRCQFAAGAQRRHQRGRRHAGRRDERDREVLASSCASWRRRRRRRHARRRRLRSRSGRALFNRRRLRALPHAVVHHRQRGDRRAGATSRSISSPTCWSTTWASVWRTASARGEAGPREFRSAPLWGLGQRVFFLHDGRTSNLISGDSAHTRARLGGQRRRVQLPAAERNAEAEPAEFPPIALTSRDGRPRAAVSARKSAGGDIVDDLR